MRICFEPASLGRRNSWLVILSVSFFALSTPIAANAALSWFIGGVGSFESLVVGDQLILDVTLRSDGEPILALEASAFGYDPAIVRLASSDLPGSVLNSFCVPGSFTCLGGFLNLISGPAVEDPSGPFGATASIFRGVSGGPITNGGDLDVGTISGIPGDPQFRLVFDVVGSGTTTINVGVDPSSPGDAAIGSGGALLGSNNASVIVFTPEPGTSLLLGLGLFALARSGNSRIA